MNANAEGREGEREFRCCSCCQSVALLKEIITQKSTVALTQNHTRDRQKEGKRIEAECAQNDAYHNRIKEHVLQQR